jgi:hypothetical protein
MFLRFRIRRLLRGLSSHAYNDNVAATDRLKKMPVHSRRYVRLLIVEYKRLMRKKPPRWAPGLGRYQTSLTVGFYDAIKPVRSPRTVVELVAATKDSDDTVMSAACQALKNIVGAKAKLLLGALTDPHARVRAAAATALGNSGDACAVEPLLEMIRDGNEMVVEAVAEALGNARDTRAVESLTKMVENPNEAIRRRAVESLGRIGDRRAVPVLMEALDSGNIETKLAAAAFARIDDPRSVKPLLDRVDECPELIWESVQQILTRSGKDVSKSDLVTISALEGFDRTENVFDGRGDYVIGSRTSRVEPVALKELARKELARRGSEAGSVL